MGAVTYPTLEHVAMQARPYPTDLLKGCKTGLVLFAAAFLGHNDAVHFAEAGIQTICCDTDGDRLGEMESLYPSDWLFVEEDAWKYVQGMVAWNQTHPHKTPTHNAFDAISVDTFTGAATRRSLDSLNLWCSLARKFVTATYTSGEAYEVPEGWYGSLYERASGVYWLVLQRQ